MSHTNSTTNYNLPQFITTDKPAWLTDVNNAYSAIDLGIKAAKDAGDNAQSDATQALTDAGNAQTTANNASSAANGAVASISEAFLDSATYNVGELVIYNNLLYICHTAVTTPGAWTGSVNWSRTDIDTQIKSLYGTTIEMSDTNPDTIASRIIELSHNPGDQMNFAFQQLFCRIDTTGKRITVFIPLSKIVKATSVTASGEYSVYDTDANSLLSAHNISNDTQAITIVNNGIILTITLTNALSMTLGYGAIELRNTFKLTFA